MNQKLSEVNCLKVTQRVNEGARFGILKSHAEKEVISKDFGCLYKLYIHAEDGGSKDFGQSREVPQVLILPCQESDGSTLPHLRGRPREREIHPRREII